MHMQIAESVKTPRKRSAKTVKPQDAEKVKATIYLSDRAAKMLGVYALMTDGNNSAVVEALILEHCRRFVVSDRARSSDEAMLESSAIWDRVHQRILDS
jgi:hypothetical protein